jgi:hypothetical protein
MSNPDRGYQGWTNYETWLVALWLQNDEALYESAMDALRIDHEDDRPDVQLKDFVEELAQEGIEGFQLDLINAALAEVNWSEIAQSFAEDLDDGREP